MHRWSLTTSLLSSVRLCKNVYIFNREFKCLWKEILPRCYLIALQRAFNNFFHWIVSVWIKRRCINLSKKDFLWQRHAEDNQIRGGVFLITLPTKLMISWQSFFMGKDEMLFLIAGIKMRNLYKDHVSKPLFFQRVCFGFAIVLQLLHHWLAALSVQTFFLIFLLSIISMWMIESWWFWIFFSLKESLHFQYESEDFLRKSNDKTNTATIF